MRFRPSLYALSFLLLTACHHPAATPKRSFSSYFRPTPVRDTLHLEISTDTIVGRVIPKPLFYKSLPAKLIKEVDYLADSSEVQLFGRQQFPLNDGLIAYWVEVKQFWFQYQALLVYNPRKKIFTDWVPVAEWIGGDGGQSLTGSWLFDYDGDGRKDLIRRIIDHSMVPNGEEWTENLQESGALLLWKNGQFVETPVPDTAAFIRRFPIRSFW
ncbi:MAG: hypothetical protein ABIO24_00810 [Saprospiraceae bacterium]